VAGAARHPASTGWYGARVAFTVLLCTDGSERSTGALVAGWALLGPDAVPVVVTVADVPDPSLLAGSGFGGPVITPEDFDQQTDRATEEARAVVSGTAEVLGLSGAETRVLHGDPAPAICRLAEELSARAIVIGSRGRGGLTRAVLGSVSDHVVRHAPCPVVVTGSHDADGR
jgi:nucleotide-binding universal stress UspA family protein